MSAKVLVVEDEEAILTGLVDLLESEGYAVAPARCGTEALAAFRREKPDLILLDVMMPEKSGYDVCREVRRDDPLVPVLMLTARGQEADKVAGLELGADDYIVKPFGVSELLARIRTALRRGEARSARGNTEPVLFGDVSVDPRTLRGRKGKKEFAVTPRELALLRLFAAREGEALDRAAILDAVWGIRYEGTTRTLDQHIVMLRKKVEDDPGSPRHILTVHGVGYRFVK
jgi:DNA-binding response OmpR family regulator